MVKIVQIPVGQMANFTYILADENSRDAVVIDPSWDLEKIFAILNKNGWKVKYVSNTHTHFDHILGNEQVAAVTAAHIIQHQESTEKSVLPVEDGQIIELAKIVIQIVHTP